jgi:hypothetical protein
MRMIKLNTVPIKTDAVTLNTYEVTCVQCGEKSGRAFQRNRPAMFCALCRSGAGEGRRQAARRSWRARKAASRHSSKRG